MAEWGRKEYTKPWPSRTRIWTLGAFFATVAFFVFAVWFDGYENWTAAQRLYLSDYLRSGARAGAGAKMQSKYTLLEGIDAKGRMRLVIDDEVQAVKGADGRYGYVLTDDGTKDGLVRLQFVAGTYNDKGIHDLLGRFVFKNQTMWDFMKRPTYFSLAFFVCLLGIALPKDRARRMVWKHGRRLRGPELVSTSEFNAKLGRPDGVAFVNEEQSFSDKIFHRKWTLGTHPARARGDALPDRGRLWHRQERGDPAALGPSQRPRRSGHRIRPCDGISATVLLGKARRCDPESA